jgi:hypothetical protein
MKDAFQKDSDDYSVSAEPAQEQAGWPALRRTTIEPPLHYYYS